MKTTGLVKDETYWAHVRRVVDQAPPLTPEQRLRLRALAAEGK